MDARFMEEALALARTGLGRVWPNPSVGCVIVQGQEIVGRGTTQPGGRPHAEVVALADAGVRAQKATVYVSLEPCAHYGRTPPCADALIKAGISRCVVALLDPDPRVDGKGVEKLRRAGVHVDLGLGSNQARVINEGFFLRVQAGRPLVTAVSAEEISHEIDSHDAFLESSPEGAGVWAHVRGTGVAPVTWWVGGELPIGGHAWRRFSCAPGPDGFEAPSVLGQLGTQGLTRVLIEKSDPLAAHARSCGLLDRDLG